MSYPLSSTMHTRTAGNPRAGIRFHDQHAQVGGARFGANHHHLPYGTGSYLRPNTVYHHSAPLFTSPRVRHSDGDCLQGLIDCISLIVCCDFLSKLNCFDESGFLFAASILGICYGAVIHSPVVLIASVAGLALATANLIK